MAALTTQSLVYAGTAPTLSAAAASDTAEVGNGNSTFIVYRNTSANVTTITVTTPSGFTPYTEATTSTVTYSLADGSVTATERWIPLHPDYAGSDGRATITTSQQTGITVAVVRTDWVV